MPAPDLSNEAVPEPRKGSEYPPERGSGVPRMQRIPFNRFRSSDCGAEDRVFYPVLRVSARMSHLDILDPNYLALPRRLTGSLPLKSLSTECTVELRPGRRAVPKRSPS